MLEGRENPLCPFELERVAEAAQCLPTPLEQRTRHVGRTIGQGNLAHDALCSGLLITCCACSRVVERALASPLCSGQIARDQLRRRNIAVHLGEVTGASQTLESLDRVKQIPTSVLGVAKLDTRSSEADQGDGDLARRAEVLE